MTALFVQEHGEDVAERYLLYSEVESWRAAQQYQEHGARLGYEPLSKAELARLQKQRQLQVDKFGPAYGERNNQPEPPKVGVTSKESNTYTDFCLINVGGLNDKGEDAVNELTYLILDVIEEMRLLQPSSMVHISKKNPDQLVERALDIIKTGYGQPSLFNTDAIIQEILRQRKSIIDAQKGGASGCVETGAFGKESYILQEISI